MTVQELIDELNKVEDKGNNVLCNWIPADKNYLFWIKNVEDDLDSAILLIDTE